MSYFIVMLFKPCAGTPSSVARSFVVLKHRSFSRVYSLDKRMDKISPNAQIGFGFDLPVQDNKWSKIGPRYRTPCYKRATSMLRNRQEADRSKQKSTLWTRRHFNFCMGERGQGSLGKTQYIV